MSSAVAVRDVWLDGPYGGRTLFLDTDKYIGEGGEGFVHSVKGENLLVKLRWPQRPLTPSDLDKLNALIVRQPANIPKGVSVAWPVALVRSGQHGQVLGFAMHWARDSKSLFTLATTDDRVESAEGVNWQFQHEVARNLSRAVAWVHRQGAVIGDLNPKNVLVSRFREIVLIDVDSWQIPDNRQPSRVFPCTVGMPDWASPELIGQSLERVVRKPEQDFFALAILVFQSLYFYHPFQGLWTGSGELTLAEKIKGGLSVLSPSSEIKPPPAAVPLRVLDEPLRKLFRQTFVDGIASPSKRVNADQWADALDTALEALESCPVDLSHFVAVPGSLCYWCEIKKKSGIDYFGKSSAAPRVPPLAERLLDSLHRGDDRQVCEWIARHDWLLRDPKCRAHAAEIEKSCQRVKRLQDWLDAWNVNQSNAWDVLDLWPADLNGTRLADTENVNGKPVKRLIEDLSIARNMVARTIRALSQWSAIRPFEQKAAHFPHDAIDDLQKNAAKLPAAYPEQASLSAELAKANTWWSAWADLKRNLEEAQRLQRDGDDDAALELLDQLQQVWPDYAAISQQRDSLVTTRMPWDTAQLRSEIKTLVASRQIRSARTKLALLPDSAMPKLRDQVRRSIEEAEKNVAVAIQQRDKGDAINALSAFTRAESLCNDLSYEVLGLTRVRAAAAEEQMRLARLAAVVVPPRKTSMWPRKNTPRPGRVPKQPPVVILNPPRANRIVRTIAVAAAWGRRHWFAAGIALAIVIAIGLLFALRHFV